MQRFKIPPSTRVFFLVSASLLWLGIALTGFSDVSWVLYIPAVFFVFAATTGICPGLIVSTWLVDNLQNMSSRKMEDAP